jgi:lipoprotein-anchoring transpeptidase ErfK/SrfK
VNGLASVAGALIAVVSILAAGVVNAESKPALSKPPLETGLSLETGLRSPFETSSDIVIEIESSTFEMRVLDKRDGELGPTIRVALGSPGQSTPTGTFPLERIILSPSWRPGVMAKLTGAEAESASLNTPMGAVKIPFASNGAIAVHGGGDARVLGKRISGGCVRATDADLLRLIAWLDGRDALSAATEAQNGEIHREFRRSIQIVVR